MNIARDFQALRKQNAPIVLAAGFFDGVHLGHQKVILRTRELARKQGGAAWVMTFDTHPQKVLNPAEAPRLLTSTRHKLLWMERFGVDGCLLLPFTRALAEEPARAFGETLTGLTPPLVAVCVGDNWHFGRRGEGSPAMLARQTAASGLHVEKIHPVTREGETVSSTRLRACLLRGRLGEAERLLGHPFSVLGTVTPGLALGRRLGFPTANLDPHNEVLPPFGVYAVQALVGGECHDGVLNLGVRPTIEEGQGAPVLELHLFAFNRDVYGEEIEVFFLEHVREECRFASREALRQGIGEDCRRARGVLAARRKAKRMALHPWGAPIYSSAEEREEGKT